jgi:hypothetical protein
MANITSIQKLLDGPRNVVVKLAGILDTSDVAATGQIGASGFTTTIGSKLITFVAGALTPTLGQYVTFSDGTTTFPAGTYITRITDATHIVVNNAALATNVAAAITITGTAGAVVLLDPAELTGLGGFGAQPTRVIVDRLSFAVDVGNAVNLYWEATTNQLAATLTDSGDDVELKHFGGAYNPEAAGVTGKLLYSTQGWSGGAILSFIVVLECRKR